MSGPVLPFACVLTMPNQADLLDHVRANAPYARRVIPPTPHKRGKRLVICGAGPSLADYVHEQPRRFADEVWACNSAVLYLMERHVRVTHAFGIDQGEGMLEDWKHPYPSLTYLVASSIHPKLRAHLLNAGCRLLWFHNFLGVDDPPGWERADQCAWCAEPAAAHGDQATHAFEAVSYELHLYHTLYPPSVRPHYGLNSVARATCLALFLGYQKIRIWGSDCGAISPSRMPSGDDPAYAEWMASIPIYADGRTALEVYGPKGAMVESPVFHGRQWATRSDMVITAQHLVTMKRYFPNRIEFMGTTLPGDLLTSDDLTGSRAVPRLENGAVQGFILHPDQAAQLDTP